MRTGSEPVTARSMLRARFWLSAWGVAWAIFGTAAFALVGRPGWAIACGVLWLVATVDMALVLRHIRQGPHYQPGPDVPPYAPPDVPTDDSPRAAKTRTPMGTGRPRLRRSPRPRHP